MSGIYMPFHIAVTNNTQEAGYFQNISTSGSWNPSFPPEVDAFETVSATDTSSGGVSDQFTIHYQSGVDFTCQFDNTVSPPKFSWSSCGSNPLNYTIQQFGPIIVGNTSKVSISIADPKVKA